MTTTPLAAFLDRAARTPFAWGEHDCMLFAADWCREATGIDPAGPFRGGYDSERGAARLLRTYGGLEAIARARMAVLGWPTTATPVAGDIGVVEAITLRGSAPAAGVFNGLAWVCLGPTGLVGAPFPILQAWSVPCRKS